MPYIEGMRIRSHVASRLNPVGGFADFWHEFKKPTPYRWPVLGFSVLMTFGLLFWVTKERVILPPERPKVSYISTFAEGRTDAEIIAGNLANQREKDIRAAEQAKREEQARDAYRALARASGMDVEAMEAEIAKERAAEEAQRKQMLDAAGIDAANRAE